MDKSKKTIFLNNEIMETIPTYTQTKNEPEKKTSIIVLPIGQDDFSFEWGLSFGGLHPKDEDYFRMPDKETAFRLKDKLSTKFPPITFDDPSHGPPSDK